VSPLVPVSLTGEEFTASYQLLRMIGVHGARSYHALDRHAGNVVMVHLLDRGDESACTQLQQRIDALPAAALHEVRVGDVSGMPYLVTGFVAGLATLHEWFELRERTASEERGATVRSSGAGVAESRLPTAPAMVDGAYETILTDEELEPVLDASDQSGVVDIALLAPDPSNEGAGTSDHPVPSESDEWPDTPTAGSTELVLLPDGRAFVAPAVSWVPPRVAPRRSAAPLLAVSMLALLVAWVVTRR
jgi:hypothetical protein